MAVLQGHRGRGVWRTAMLPHQQLATAGADGSVKIWSLAEHVPASCLEEPAKSCENSGDSAAEGIKTARAERGPQMEAFKLLQSTAPFASSGECLRHRSTDAELHSNWYIMHAIVLVSAFCFKCDGLEGGV